MAGYSEQRYSVEVLQEDGAAIEEVLARDERLDVAQALYELMRTQLPGRTLVLRDAERIIARSDQQTGPVSLQ